MDDIDQDEVPRKIGALLLKGYTLLNSYCHRCMAPMMKPRDGDEMCVICPPVSVKRPTNGEVKLSNEKTDPPASMETLSFEGAPEFPNMPESLRNFKGLHLMKKQILHKIYWASGKLQNGNAHDSLKLIDKCLDLLKSLGATYELPKHCHEKVIENFSIFIDYLFEKIATEETLPKSIETVNLASFTLKTLEKINSLSK